MTTAGGHSAQALELERFDATSFPSGVRVTAQVQYLRCYLTDLCAQSLVEEPQYFDRDYLAEFAAFYSTSSKGYRNVCRRFHLFELALPALRRVLAAAISGNVDALTELNRCYLGFVVVRPLEMTPLGRTVLRLYPERRPDYPRETRAARRYRANLAGLPLEVHGLAWQQQDRGVGACATVALWTMFHASALDEHQVVPTTAEVTRAAHSRWPFSRRMFPADGLNVHQLCDAIKAQRLLPVVLEGDETIRTDSGKLQVFGRARFAASCAALLRSGYPVLVAARILGDLGAEGHAVTIVGFRPTPSPEAPSGACVEEDGAIEHLYVHDDNLGPSVRFAIEDALTPNGYRVTVLRADPPPPLNSRPALPDPTTKYFKLVPTSLVAALPDEIRISSDYLHSFAAKVAQLTAERLAQIAASLPGVSFSASFMQASAYVRSELGRCLEGRRLAKARLALSNQVRPLSLYLGVVRIGLGGAPLFDLLLDTTDSELSPQIFAHIMFQPFRPTWLPKDLTESWGKGVVAF